MPAPIDVVRWTFFALGAFGVLAGTVLFRPIYDALVGRWLRTSEALAAGGGPAAQVHDVLAPMLRRRGLFRAWYLLWAALFLGAWWYLGTSGGVALWNRVGPTADARTGR